MKIKFAFDSIPDEIQAAIATIHVEDQSEADAPIPRLFSTSLELPPLRRSQPTITVEVDLPVAIVRPDLSLVVRVRAHTPDNQPIEFLNTTTTPLPAKLDETVQVTLSRIV
jgi:hypothetical protein